jgi:hypothetical protein
MDSLELEHLSRLYSPRTLTTLICRVRRDEQDTGRVPRTASPGIQIALPIRQATLIPASVTPPIPVGSFPRWKAIGSSMSMVCSISHFTLTLTGPDQSTFPVIFVKKRLDLYRRAVTLLRMDWTGPLQSYLLAG